MHARAIEVRRALSVCVLLIADVKPALADPVDEPVYVIEADRVHVVSAADLERLRSNVCKPKGKLSFHRPPPGVAEHCHGRLFVAAKLSDVSSATESGVEQTTTGAIAAGFSLWAYVPRGMRALAEVDIGGGFGADGELAYEQLFGYAFSVPGPALRGGWNLELRGSPDFLHSRFEFPPLALAWVFGSGFVAGEIGARGAPVLIGRFNVHSSSELLGGAVAYGPYGVASIRGGSLRHMLLAELFRFERERPLYEIDARVCSGTGYLLGCVRVEERWLTSARSVEGLFEASARQTAVTLSFGLAAP